MTFLLYLTNYILPGVILFIVCYGVLMKVSVYDTFIKGAKSGFFTVIRIMPTLIALMVTVGVLRASGFLDFLAQSVSALAVRIGFPAQLVPLSIVRMFSSSAATGLALDIFKEYGTDSRIGMIASLLMSSTETIFYTMSVYFVAAKIKKTRHTLAGALLCTFAGMAASVWLAGIMMN